MPLQLQADWRIKNSVGIDIPINKAQLIYKRRVVTGREVDEIAETIVSLINSGASGIAGAITNGTYGVIPATGGVPLTFTPLELDGVFIVDLATLSPTAGGTVELWYHGYPDPAGHPTAVADNSLGKRVAILTFTTGVKMTADFKVK